MIVCPAGHQSEATDYCDVCGIAMPPPGSAAKAPSDSGPADGAGGVGGADAVVCPNCSTPNPADALFCENCGYDFTTGTLPRTAPPTPDSAASDATGLISAVPDDGADKDAADALVVPAPDPSPAPTLTAGWVAEVWIDPDWYLAQGSSDPLPSPGLPTVIALRHTSVLIGRSSRSRGISPEIDVTSDSGVSRRHAQLSTDGSRWFVEDLGSSNGSFVGDAGAPLPDQPLPAGQKRELDADDRIYLGAWTRIVVRKADEGELD